LCHKEGEKLGTSSKFDLPTEKPNATCQYSKVKVKCTRLQALKLCTGRTAHRGSRGIALLFLDHGTIRTVHTTYAAAFKTTTHPKTRCRKPYAATQHLMLLMTGVCT